MSIAARYLGLRDYASVHQAMAEYTNQRNRDSRDEIWFLEHPPVYTLGLSERLELAKDYDVKSLMSCSACHR